MSSTDEDLPYSLLVYTNDDVEPATRMENGVDYSWDEDDELIWHRDQPKSGTDIMVVGMGWTHKQKSDGKVRQVIKYKTVEDRLDDAHG